jgi:transposase-like protein
MTSLKHIQIEAARLLATGETITSVAEKIGSVRATIHRWMREDYNFIAYLNALKKEQLESTRAQIQSASSIAINTLVDVMQSSKSDIARINAAKEVLSMSGFSKDSTTMYGWGVGEDTPEKVKAQKQSDKLMESLLTSNFDYNTLLKKQYL